MKTLCFLLMMLSIHIAMAQKVTNLIFVGDNGATEDFTKAHSFIVVKQYPSYFERLDYKKAGPMTKSRSYKDVELKILEGNYFEYRPDGTMLYAGNYLDNKKDGYWQTYDDTGKVVYSAKYVADSIVEVQDLEKEDSVTSYADEREADFNGGQKAWVKYLLKSLQKSNAADKTAKGGTVRVRFKLDINGDVKDIQISKSVEYVLDSESINIISNSPKWIPAWQNGKAVNAYRIQPITFAVSE